MNPPPSAKPGRHCGCQPRVAEILIRHASLADAPRLAAIDAESSPSPWSEQAVRDSLAHALALVATRHLPDRQPGDALASAEPG